MKKEQLYNFYKEAKFYEICGDVDEKLTVNYPMHSVLNFIYFNKGCAIATNTVRMVVAPINEISNLHDEDIQKLNGYLIHKDFFKNLLKRPKIIEITGNKIKCKPMRSESQFYDSVTFEMHKASEFELKFPPYEKIMDPPRKDSSEEISFDVDNLQTICQGVGKHCPIITPNGLDGSIKVRFQESEIKAFIMSINYKKDIYI